jgi:exosortase/archaeosortase family protein
MKYNSKVLLEEQYLIPFKIISVYIGWKLFDHFAEIPGTTLNHFWTSLVYHLGCVYAVVTSFILTIGGLKATASSININLVASNKQVWVQEHCLAIPAIVVFCGAILLFKGRWSEKAMFLAIGLSGIICINLLRLILVSVAFVQFSPHIFRLMHSYVYAIVTYAFIFGLVAWWMNRTTENSTE